MCENPDLERVFLMYIFSDLDRIDTQSRLSAKFMQSLILIEVPHVFFVWLIFLYAYTQLRCLQPKNSHHSNPIVKMKKDSSSFS